MLGDEASESELRERLAAILRSTPPLMRVLSVARRLCLPDWLVFSGAVYQPVLNHLTDRPLDYGVRDYDLGYFEASDLSYEAEDAVIRRVRAGFDEPLRSMVEVRNQARVHLWFEAKFGESYTPLSCTAPGIRALCLGDIRGRHPVGILQPAPHRGSFRSCRSVRDAFAAQSSPEDSRLRPGLSGCATPLARSRD
jgi:Nucleotidyltransferase